MVSTRYQDIELTSFAGGITDKFVEGNPTEAEEINNLDITDIGKIEISNGFSVFYDSFGFVQDRIMHIALHDNDTILVNRSGLLFELDENANDLVQIAVPNGAPFFSVVGADKFPSSDTWRRHTLYTNSGTTTPVVNLTRPMIAYRDGTFNMAAAQAGLPAYDEDLLTNVPNPGGAFSYLYRIHYSIEYDVEELTFKTLSFTQQYVSQVGTAISGGFTNTITNIQTISPVGGIDIANVKVEIYRTISTGQDFFKVGEVNHGVTSFNDNVTDTDLVSNEDIYTRGGVVEHAQPPKCRFVFVVNDKAYYLSIIEESSAGETFRPYRFTESVPGNISGVGDNFFTDVDDDITGGAAVNGLPIIFTRSFIYRIEGSINALGDGVVRKRVISDTIGCVSHRSIVNIGKLLFFFGNDGIYQTNGYEITLLTPRLEETYKQFVQGDRAERIVGTYDNRNERIIWAVADTDTENNKWFVLNLKSGGFSTRDSRIFQPTAMVEKNGDLFRGDNLGYIYKHSDDDFFDVVRDATKTSVDWLNTHIDFSFKSSAINFGAPGVKKWVSHATIASTSKVKFAYTPTSNNDNKGVFTPMHNVRIFDKFVWDDIDFIWDDKDVKWRADSSQVKTRHFPRTHARCFRKQIGLQPAETLLFRSDTYEPADVVVPDPVFPQLFTVTLPVGVEWPNDILNGAKIRFETDDYTTGFLITARTAQTITVQGGGGPGNSVGLKWEIHGFNLRQRAEFLSVNIKFAPLSRQGAQFQKEESGGNE